MQNDVSALLTIARGDPLALPGTQMSLTFRHHYRIAETDDPDRGPWKATTVAYLYDIDDQGGELLSYHWHPIGEHPDLRPHLHVRDPSGARVRLPAGRVAIEDIIRVLIQEYGVTPLRDDWASVLDTAQDRFEEWRTWS